MRVAAKERHWGSHTEDTPGCRMNIGDLAGGLTVVADTSSATDLQAQLKLAHGQLRQTCVMGARQRTIASGSCCCYCSPLRDSRSLAVYRTESLAAATAHSMAVRHGLGPGASAPATGF